MLFSCGQSASMKSQKENSSLNTISSKDNSSILGAKEQKDGTFCVFEKTNDKYTVVTQGGSLSKEDLRESLKTIDYKLTLATSTAVGVYGGFGSGLLVGKSLMTLLLGLNIGTGVGLAAGAAVVTAERMARGKRLDNLLSDENFQTEKNVFHIGKYNNFKKNISEKSLKNGRVDCTVKN